MIDRARFTMAFNMRHPHRSLTANTQESRRIHVTSTLDLQHSDSVIDALRQAAEAMRASPLRCGCCINLPARGTLLVTGDLHDNPVHFQKIVRLARLDDSPDRHVIFQELIHSERLVNGVDLSHRVLIRVADLVNRFPGQVHPILANHELAQMTGKGVSKGAGNSVELFNDGLDFVYHDAWEDVSEAVNAFIRAMPLAVRSESGVFCAHSIPSPQMLSRFDPGVLDRDLTDDDYRASTGSAYVMVWGRGQSDEQIDALARAWDVSLFCLGHEFVETGCEMRGSRVIRINSDHEHGAVLPIDLANLPGAERAMVSAIRLAAIG